MWPGRVDDVKKNLDISLSYFIPKVWGEYVYRIVNPELVVGKQTREFRLLQNSLRFLWMRAKTTWTPIKLNFSIHSFILQRCQHCWRSTRLRTTVQRNLEQDTVASRNRSQLQQCERVDTRSSKLSSINFTAYCDQPNGKRNSKWPGMGSGRYGSNNRINDLVRLQRRRGSHTQWIQQHGRCNQLTKDETSGTGLNKDEGKAAVEVLSSAIPIHVPIDIEIMLTKQSTYLDWHIWANIICLLYVNVCILPMGRQAMNHMYRA